MYRNRTEFVTDMESHPDHCSEVARKAIKAIKNAESNFIDTAVVVDNRNAIDDTEVAEFCRILESIACNRILWTSNYSGFPDVLAKFYGNRWAVTGVTEVNNPEGDNFNAVIIERM